MIETSDLVHKTFLTGSFKRHTAVHSKSDVDIFVEFVDAAAADPQGSLIALFQTLIHVFPVDFCRLQTHSLGVKINGVNFDIVPSFRVPHLGLHVLAINNTVSGTVTSPKETMRVCSELNQVSGGILLGLVRLAKLWNYKLGKPLRSFHIECMAYDFVRLCHSSQWWPDSWAHSMLLFFEYMRDNHDKDCFPPGSPHPLTGSSLALFDAVEWMKRSYFTKTLTQR